MRAAKPTAWRVTFFFALVAFGCGCVSIAGFAAMDATRGAVGEVRIQGGKTARPQLFFACDRHTSDLPSLFTSELISELKSLNGGVALSTVDFTSARAQVVRQLNAAGIPVIAWLVLPGEQGYYVNAGNAPEAATHFAEFDQWTTDNGLRWAAVGLDIEPNLEEFGMFQNHKLRLAWLLLRRAFDSGRVRRAHDSYDALIQRIQSRGYTVQTYQFLFMADARRAGSHLLERIFGLVDVRGNDEVLMIYTSFNHILGASLIWQYGPDAQTIAVGSTAASGDPVADAKFPALNWGEFSRDLIVAHYFSSVIGVYSLDGCVKQGFMPRLSTMDWNQTVVLSAASVKMAARFRTKVQTALWIASHLLYFAAAFFLIAIWLTRVMIRSRRRKRAIAPSESNAA